MAYEKQTWDTNSYVNPTRMNHIENGIQENSDEVGVLKQNIADLGLGWDVLINDESLSSTKKTISTYNNRNIKDYDFIIAMVRPSASVYMRGFAILPTDIFVSGIKIEGDFVAVNNSYLFYDLEFSSDTSVSTLTNYTNDTLKLYVYGLKINK